MTHQTNASLGARIVEDGVRFSVWAPSATTVDLVLITDRPQPATLDMHRDDAGVWSRFVPGVGDGQLYAFRVDGPWAPEQGLRFNPHKIVLDPYARAIVGGVDFRADIRAHRTDAPRFRDENDSLGSVPLGVVVADTPPPTPIARRRPMAESVIYETHLRGFTKLHPHVPDHLRGSYLGMADPAVVDYLRDLGVTAVELLPVHHFVSEPFIALKGLRNYWGYNTLGFFAPHSMYKAHGMGGDHISHFKQMVSALHEAGIEVILDVVYNHTAEGGVDGPTLSFRGLDQRAYYRMSNDHRTDYDVTGVGNSVNTAHPMVRRLIIDSMRYWVQEMGVDGFRFDLATTMFRDAEHHVVKDHELRRMINEDPVFDDIKLIAEPWDIGPFGYQVGNFGHGWSEWNDKFRDHVRDFWRGHAGGVNELATRLAGSPDIYDVPGRGPHASINFVTAHDGFTMRDLVSYDVKHNQANGESNRDGTDNNRSWNHGWEGETYDPQINRLRRRQVLNFHATQLLAVGTPMLVAGDEFGRTQEGNNNAYCQDSPVSWVNWDIPDEWLEVREKVKALIRLRADHEVLRSPRYRYHQEIKDHDGEPLRRIDLTWVDADGSLMNPGAWGDTSRQLLGMYVSDLGTAFLAWFNSSPERVDVTLSGPQTGCSWQVAWTSAEDHELTPAPYAPEQVVAIPARSVVLLRAEVATTLAELESAMAGHVAEASANRAR
jgi:glycogen debranching enzyme